MMLKALNEFREVVASFDSPKSFLGVQKCGRAPTQHHLGFVPPLDPPGPGVGPGEAALNQVRRVESLDQRLLQSQPTDRQGLFESFLQAAGRAGTEAFQPPDAGTQL